MISTSFRIFVLTSLAVVTVLAGGRTAVRKQGVKATPMLVMLDMGPGAESHLRPNSNQVSFTRSTKPGATGIDVTIKPGREDYPGVHIKPPLNAWNLSPFGHVEARVTNTGAKPMLLALRVDNDGDWKDNPWNTESATLDPGATETISTMFGYSYGHKPGFKLKSQAVVNVLLFTGKSDQPQSFRIESLVASGVAGEKPPVAPDDVRIKPVGGVIFGYNATLDLATQVQTQGVQPLLVGTDKQPSVRLAFPISKTEQSITVKPPTGRWDLRDCLEVKVSIRNMGKAPFTPRVKLDSNGGPTEWVTSSSPIEPGAKTTLTIPFAGTTPFVVGKKGTGTLVTSDAIASVSIALDSPEAERIAYLDSIQGGVPINTKIPEWLGQRPPVEGEWVKTLDDEFDGSTLDSSIWDLKGENYYDKVTHWSREDVNVTGGAVHLKYEKRLGFHNDDPTRPRSDYAAGFLQTYDKWTQRYGYFEARMKLPKAPGLWPAFWMMPERGVRTTSQGERQDTANGGMEFDIAEQLTRWGPYRYNIAMHYDGYGINHKSVGSDKIYVQPDKDGFVTCGLLWTPGSAIFYCNGREVLRWEDARISNVASCFLFTLPSGGWDNNQLEDSQLPDEFLIDYVRVWQRKDLASTLDGKKAPPSKGTL